MAGKEGQPGRTVELLLLDKTPPDPELVLDIYRRHIEIRDDAKIRRTLDTIAAEFAEEKGLHYERVTEDPSILKTLQKFLRRDN